MFLAAGSLPTHEDGTFIRSSPDANINVQLQRAHTALESLKSQHAALLRSFPVVHNDSLPQTMRGPLLSKTAEEKPDELLSASGFSVSSNRQPNRISSTTDLSDSVLVEWFDAEDNFGEEFLLEDQMPEDKAQYVSPSASSSLNEYESASSDEEDHVSPKAVRNDDSILSRQVVRRTHLPSGPIGDEGSLFAILKKNVGKVCFTYLIL